MHYQKEPLFNEWFFNRSFMAGRNNVHDIIIEEIALSMD